jgi:hypothetical protein
MLNTAKSELGFRNKEAGNRFEIKIANREKRNSLFSLHSHGSFGFCDVMSRKRNGEIWYITCKTNGYLSIKERQDIAKFKILQKPWERLKLAYYINKKHYTYKTL